MIEIKINIGQTGPSQIETAVTSSEKWETTDELVMRDQVLEYLDRLMEDRLKAQGGILLQQNFPKKDVDKGPGP